MGNCASNTAGAGAVAAQTEVPSRSPSATLLGSRLHIDKKDIVQDKGQHMVCNQCPAQRQAKLIVRVDVDTQTGFWLNVDTPDMTLSNIRALVQNAEAEHVYLIGCVDMSSYDPHKFNNPFPTNSVKDTVEWQKIPGTLLSRCRFIPVSMGHTVVGDKQSAHYRSYTPKDFSEDVRSGMGCYLATSHTPAQLYSAYTDPDAKAMISQLAEDLGGPAGVTFQVFGYCTGGYCVDGFAKGLREDGYDVEVVLDATVAIGGEDGMAKSRAALEAIGCRMITTEDASSVVRAAPQKEISTPFKP